MDDDARRGARRRATVAFVVAAVLLVADVAVVAASNDHREYRHDRIGLDHMMRGQDDNDMPYGGDRDDRGSDERGDRSGPNAAQPPGRNLPSRRNGPNADRSTTSTTTSTTVAGGI